MSSRFLVPWLVVLAFAGAAAPQNPANDSSSQTVVGQISSTDANIRGAVQFAAGGAQLMSGSWVQAGETTAELRLARGGEVRVCPQTSLSITSSQNGRDLMFGLNTGAVEAHYTLSSSADTILTPDFRILMAGPGTFHFAIGVDVKGNSCVQSLAQNTASVIVSEMMGDGMYQVKPNEQVMFHSGKVGSPDHQPGTCGCAPAATEVMRAEARPPAPRTEPAKPEIPVSLAQPLPAEDLHVQVDAPFVYSGSDADPVILEGATHLRVTAAPALPIIVLPPPASQAQAAPVQASAKAPEKPPEKRKFFGKVRAFFASIFR